MRPLLLHKSCQTKAIVDFSDLTIRMRVSHTRWIVLVPLPSRGHMNGYLTMVLLRPDIVCACVLTQLPSKQSVQDLCTIVSSNLHRTIIKLRWLQRSSTTRSLTLLKHLSILVRFSCSAFLFMLNFVAKTNTKYIC